MIHEDENAPKTMAEAHDRFRSAVLCCKATEEAGLAAEQEMERIKERCAALGAQYARDKAALETAQEYLQTAMYAEAKAHARKLAHRLQSAVVVDKE